MRSQQLIAALQDECRAERTKIEDFLLAISDLGSEALAKGDAFNLPHIGVFRIHTSKHGQPRVAFSACSDFKKKLNLPDKYDRRGPLCEVCNKNEREKSRSRCRACRAKNYRRQGSTLPKKS